jgi:hypothetical protein
VLSGHERIKLANQIQKGIWKFPNTGKLNNILLRNLQVKEEKLESTF